MVMLWYSVQELTARVTMLADDETVAALRRHAKSLAHQEPETGRVQHRAGPDHTVFWQPAELPGHIRQDVN